MILPRTLDMDQPPYSNFMHSKQTAHSPPQQLKQPQIPSFSPFLFFISLHIELIWRLQLNLIRKSEAQAMKQQDHDRTINCPDCNRNIKINSLRDHIRDCQKYVPTYLNNISRFMSHYTSNYLEFLNVEMDLIKEQLMKSIQEKRKKQVQPKPQSKDIPVEKKIEVEKAPVRSAGKSSIQSYIDSKKVNTLNAASPPKNTVVKKEEPVKQEVNSQISAKSSLELENLFQNGKKNSFSQIKKEPKQQWEGTLELDDIQDNGIFKDQKQKYKDQKIKCVYPGCKDPVSVNYIQQFTYLDECLHTVCVFCFRDFIRKTYVKAKGDIKCPDEKCGSPIPYIQIKQIVDASVLTKLQNDLNNSSLDLIECQKCHEHYQFQKGKPSDAPKKTQDGKSVTSAMAKHHAENRFQCPKCRTEQCKACKAVPYHLGFTCSEYQEHKLKKKCRYCHNVLPKAYMSETGIKTFDDICDSDECSGLTKEACSKMLACGHPCYGYIRQKSCLPCLNEKCAAAKSQELRGQNENSFCSLCYVEVLSQSPCVRSKCGHIFHFKCLKKRLELKWETARIIFRFCQCPLCNKWLQLPQESPLTKVVQQYKQLFDKIKEKALKRLTYEGANKDAVLNDASSPYFRNEEKYSMTIYAYFECFQCHQPYFGGRKSCAQAMSDPKAGEKFNPKELICPGCCPVQTTDCKKHGKEYISFKCRFCCSVAQWFCWGNTHFCDGCHKKQIAGQYISRIPKDKLPQCQGKAKCPVGGEHGGNGDEFCLGCGICRGDRLDFKDF